MRIFKLTTYQKKNQQNQTCYHFSFLNFVFFDKRKAETNFGKHLDGLPTVIVGFQSLNTMCIFFFYKKLTCSKNSNFDCPLLQQYSSHFPEFFVCGTAHLTSMLYCRLSFHNSCITHTTTHLTSHFCILPIVHSCSWVIAALHFDHQ